MPQFERYPGENPAKARRRILKNKLTAKNPAAKSKSNLVDSVMPTIKNMGY